MSLEYSPDDLDAFCDGVSAGDEKGPVCMVYLVSER